jgi:Outer membrane protein beta-barrel domain
MKRALPLLFFFFVIFSTTMAQQNNEPEFKRFGFRAGVNFSHINFAKGSPPPTVPIETSWGTGINIGFQVALPLTGNLYFEPEYLYTQTGGEIKTAATVYKLNYFSMPVLLKYQLSEKFSFHGGPQFDILINAKKTVNGVATNITHDTEERSISAAAGVEYELTNSLSVCARYLYGLNHIGIGQRSSVQEFKYEMAQLTGCIRF